MTKESEIYRARQTKAPIFSKKEAISIRWWAQCTQCRVRVIRVISAMFVVSPLYP
jgi:hypothetical protein